MPMRRTWWQVLKVYIGLPFAHDVFSMAPVKVTTTLIFLLR